MAGSPSLILKGKLKKHSFLCRLGRHSNLDGVYKSLIFDFIDIRRTSQTVSVS